MSRLTLYLLGSPRIERDGTPIEVDTRKATALLAYLAVTCQSTSRDTLANLFWPDYDQTRARAALRRTLSTLKQALAGDWLDADRETVSLERGSGFWFDVDDFRAWLAQCRSHGHAPGQDCPECIGPLTRAVALYRDDFMAGFSLRDSPDFDNWQFLQSESLRGELASALERLVRCHTAQGDFETAIAHARRWLALDPLHEPAHRHLMQLYSWSGQRAAALRQYRECVRILDQELGVPPLEETTRLSQAIEENHLPPPRLIAPAGRTVPAAGGPPSAPEPPESAAPLASAPAELPLVGRAAEWDRLVATCDGMRADGRLVILEGEAGIGKTRLAEEFLKRVQAQGVPIVRARCYEGQTSLVYGPFVEGLRAALAQPGCADWARNVPSGALSEASRLLPELANLQPDLPPAAPLDSPGAQTRFFDAISQVLGAVCTSAASPTGSTSGRSVLFLDDLHWADEASLDLLTFLVRRLRGRPLFILVTWRGEELASGHRLRGLLTEAQRAGLATVLHLSRLSLSAVKELLQSAGPSASGAQGTALPPGVGERLYRETEGLPFFLVEYLATLAQAGDVPGSESGGWELSSGARELLHSRLAIASETGRQLLSTAAVIGRSFDFDTLREASGRSDEETVNALDALIAQGLVKEVQGSDEMGMLQYDFSHEKLRALVYDETSLARRRLLHRRIAEALTFRARTRPSGRERGDLYLASQIAQHYERAGQDQQAAEYYLLAGQHARALYANAEALAHFRLALALGHPNAATLHESIGDLQTLSGDYGAALASYETAAALGEASSLGRLEHKLGDVHRRRGEWDQAESHFSAALAAWGKGGPAVERSRLYADWSLMEHHRNQAGPLSAEAPPDSRLGGQALELAQRAMELAQAAGDARALAQAHNILGILASSRGDPDQACDHLEQSLKLAESLGDPAARAAALNNLALACGSRGDTDQAIRWAEAGLALCASLGDRHREAALHNNLADLLHAAGRSDEAMAHLKQAVAIFAEIGMQSGTLQPEIWKLAEW